MGGKREGAGRPKKDIKKTKYFSFRTDENTKQIVNDKIGRKRFRQLFEEWVKSLINNI